MGAARADHHITASPAKGLEPTLALTERLTGHGYRAVPHLSARLVRDPAHLADIVARLTAAGVDDVFVPAGDADPPAGRFHSALALLDELDRMGRPFARVGITGYPESHPKIGDDVTVQAMWDKRHHAAYIVSNLCFDAATLTRWIARIRARGITLPLLVGLAGPLERTRLLRLAAVSGVAESARFLAGHADWLVRLGLPGGYSPGRLLDRGGPALTDPARPSRGCTCSASTSSGRPSSGAGPAVPPEAGRAMTPQRDRAPGGNGPDHAWHGMPSVRRSWRLLGACLKRWRPTLTAARTP